jgi:transposase-like protein
MRFQGVTWQRCRFHLQQNAMVYVPRVSMRSAVAEDICNIFQAANRRETDRLLKRTADKWRNKAPNLAKWMEEHVSQSLTVFSLPCSHR